MDAIATSHFLLHLSVIKHDYVHNKTDYCIVLSIVLLENLNHYLLNKKKRRKKGGKSESKLTKLKRSGSH